MRTSVPVYRRHRFPSEIISHCVWLYFRFSQSFRDVEELISSRGVSLTYETVREWCLKFGQTYANGLRRKSPRPSDQWHLDEVFLKSTDASKVRLVQIADEIIAVLATDPNAEVKVSIEIQANFPNGTQEQTKRAVSENAKTLGFNNAEWE